MSLCRLRPNRFRFFALVFLWVAIRLVSPAVQGHENPAELPLLTNYNSFWNIPESERHHDHRVRFEAEVLFNDPVWRVMWLENEGMPFYCNTGEESFDLEAGDKVLLEARVSPLRGFVPMDLSLTLLGRAGPRPPPPDVTDRLDRIDPFNEHVVSLSGYVEVQEEVGTRHVRLRMVVGGRPLVANVLIGETEAIPQLAGQMVSVSALLFLNKRADGGIGSLDLWVDGFGAIRSRGPLAEDPRFKLPLSTGDALHEAEEGAVVQVQGVVRVADAGVSLVLWDEADQISVLSAQLEPVEAGEVVAAVGELVRRGPDLFLRDALWRKVGAQPVEIGRLKLRRAAQVLELGLNDASRGDPVELWGVVTWSDPAVPFFYIQDSTRGICVSNSGPWRTNPPGLGTSVRVLGATEAGPFAPQVAFERFVGEGAIRLPEPRPITLEQLQTGTEEGRRVQLSGFVRDVERDGLWTVLRLTATTGECVARLVTDSPLESLRGAVVRLSAVCRAIADEQGQLVSIELLVGSRADIKVEQPAVSDPFSVAEVPMGSLRRFGPLETPYRRVRTRGVVTLVESGRRLILQEGAVGLEVLCREPVGVRPGDEVEAVGFPGRQGPRFVLREAVVRATGAVKAVPVRVWPAERRLVPEWDNQLVQVEGVLEELLVGAPQLQLLLKAGGRPVLAQYEGTSTGALRRGSRVAVTGVYRVNFDVFGHPSWSVLQLRELADVVVLAPSPRFTLGHALVGLAAVALAAGAALLWAGLLRRQVKFQTRQIREQIERQAKLEAELQKAAKLESLGLLAGGIAHDFNNLLTVVLGNITLAMLEEQAMAVAGDCLLDAERGAQRAKDLTHQLLTFAKGGEPLRAAEVLPEIVREAAEFVLRGSTVRCDYEFDAGLWPADVDRGQIGQVIHNLVLNAKQAMVAGGVIRVKASNEELASQAVNGLAAGRYVRLCIADTGPGIPAAMVGRLFDPYFTTKKGGSGLGLATVHSIVRRHRGHIEVHSEPGHGSVFRIWLPAAEGAAGSAPAPTAPRPRSLSGRVLVMDDEEDIRRLVISLLRRLGLEAVGVPDGAEAIRVYSEAKDSGRPFALAIMDLTVPGGMGGREAMEELRRLDPGIRAIVSSGYSNDPVLANYRDHGFAGMVEKPYEVEKLMECVGRVLSDA